MACITRATFDQLAGPLLGLPVTHTWRGHGTAIFLELGKLSPSRRNNPRGQATVMVEWSWRVEGPRSILFGSFSTKRKIEMALPSLVGRTLAGVELFGRLPEVSLRLTGDRWVSSFATAEGQPEWALLLGDHTYVGVKRGALFHGPSQ